MTCNVPRGTTRSGTSDAATPLRVATEINRCVIAQVGDDRRDLAECFTDGRVQSKDDEENARRLVACWNACLGIKTETLEQIGPRAVMAQAELLRQAIERKPMRAATYHAIKAALKAWGGRS